MTINLNNRSRRACLASSNVRTSVAPQSARHSSTRSSRSGAAIRTSVADAAVMRELPQRPCQPLAQGIQPIVFLRLRARKTGLRIELHAAKPRFDAPNDNALRRAYGLHDHERQHATLGYQARHARHLDRYF